MEPRWRIELLGGLRAVQGDRAITRFRTLKSGELLAYLAHHRQRPHPREVLKTGDRVRVDPGRRVIEILENR